MSAHQLHRSLARLNLRCFNVRPQRVQILRTPTAFYESLIERCDRATTRVTLSALYWGTGPLAVNLAEAVARAASRGVAVNVTLDAARAGRRCEINLPAPSLRANRGLSTTFDDAFLTRARSHEHCSPPSLRARRRWGAPSRPRRAARAPPPKGARWPSARRARGRAPVARVRPGPEPSPTSRASMSCWISRPTFLQSKSYGRVPSMSQARAP